MPAPKKPEPPSVVTMKEGALSAPPSSTPSSPPVVSPQVPTGGLCRANDLGVIQLARCLRELLMEAQRRRMDGTIRVDLTVQNGSLQSLAPISTRWNERIVGTG